MTQTLSLLKHIPFPVVCCRHGVVLNSTTSTTLLNLVLVNGPGQWASPLTKFEQHRTWALLVPSTVLHACQPCTPLHHLIQLQTNALTQSQQLRNHRSEKRL